ncbi:S-layer homology domain-containing protein [Vallitalea pronyensis]|uniref:S-layer homology domain-containing protein n=1 Tax=Vallitalea pronyensis TaxID=1348613 RepID=A0A8J8MKU0_9FIRM|nr:S-layer homology domain-containing protein [Vallitalea pronyensis]QUI23702.1 S-layer homology domain-containing protein [Vallitalea pronyensis]
MKKSILLSALLLLVMGVTNTSVTYATQTYQPSSWSSQSIDITAKAGLIPDDFSTQPFTNRITRRDFCDLLINTCRIYGITLPELPASHPFKDTTDEAVEYAYMLGLIQGTGEGMFSPDMPLTREMAAVMVSKILILFQSSSDEDMKNKVHTTATGTLTYTLPMGDEESANLLNRYAVDYSLVSTWAKVYMADVYTLGILLGTGEGKLDPKSNLTREQAVMLSLKVLTYCDESPIRAIGVDTCILPGPTGIYISPSYQADNVMLRWNAIPSATAYDVTISQNGVTSYMDRIHNHYLDLRNGSLDNYLINSKQFIHADIQVTPVNKNGEASIYSLQQTFNIFPKVSINEMITGDPNKNQFKDIHEANANMTTITVKVWQLTSSGTKKTAQINLKVNKNLAHTIEKIFEDIYNGDEKFPIKSASCYDYRNGRSQHSNGTAIDINPQENYFIALNGVIKAGTLWQPGVNPYSIIPDGDVVQAFNRYGWHWSPDRHWSSGADYMHFSLNGN